jgi:hypothetical protein
LSGCFRSWGVVAGGEEALALLRECTDREEIYFVQVTRILGWSAAIVVRASLPPLPLLLLFLPFK